MGFVQRRLLKAVMKVVTYPRITLAIAGMVLLASVGLAVMRLTISTDQNKLFSHEVKFFKDFLEFSEKFPEYAAIYLIIEPADGKPAPAFARWMALADAITARLRAMPDYVESADCKVPLDKLGAQGILFESPAELAATVEEAKRFVPLVKLWGQKPDALTALMGSSPMERFLSGLSVQTPDAETATFVKALADGWNATLADPAAPLEVGKQVPDLSALEERDPSRLGYYYVKDESDPARHLMLVRIFYKCKYNSLTSISESVDAIRAAVKDVASQYPDLKVGATGRPALEADEMRTTDRDTHRAEIVALSVVFIGLVLTLRSIWLALVAEISLAVGIGWTFGFATVTVGELNLLSIVFVIALIGIGMDYLIQILTRYRREARRYVRPKAIWARVFRYVSPPIVTACLGAAGAFLVSLLTDFRGAAELGIIAGGGLLLCLLAGYTVLPALLVLFPAKLKPVSAARRYAEIPIGRAGPWRIVMPAVWAAALLIGIPFMMRARFDPNLLNLQAPNLESVKLVKKVQTWSAAVLSKDLEMLRKVRGSLEGAATIARTDSILDAYDNYAWLKEHPLPAIAWAEPDDVKASDLDRLIVKLRAIGQRFAGFEPTAASLRQLADRLAGVAVDAREASAARLSQWQRQFIGELRKMLEQFNPAPLDLSRVPRELRDHLVSADGTYVLYVYPHPTHDLWIREHLEAFMNEVDARVNSVPGSPGATGIASDIHHSTRAIEKAFYSAAAYALALIFILVLIDLRKIGQTLLAISVLALGLPMLVALMGLLGVSWNFANFFGLPILIGAAHEYGVFMMHRYKEVLHDPRRVWRGWDVSDKALLLCAFVTSSSFGFFWAMGHHEGLRSLGLVMALGCACIYLATIMVVRPLLMRRLERKRIYAINVAGPTSGPATGLADHQPETGATAPLSQGD